jgi:hypothetical protein
MASNLYSPYTVTLADSLPAAGRARGGYVCYATAGYPSNAAPSHAGQGDSPREAAAAATYWANQAPWVRVVPASRAPQWAVEEASRVEQENEALFGDLV